MDGSCSGIVHFYAKNHCRDDCANLRLLPLLQSIVICIVRFEQNSDIKKEKSEISPNFQTFSQKLSILSFSTQFIPLSQNQLKKQISSQIRTNPHKSAFLRKSSKISCNSEIFCINPQFLPKTT